LPPEGEGQARPVTEPFLIVAAAVAGVLLVLVAASMFGVSRRAVEAEIRRVEEEEQAEADEHLAA
jgi:type II secretory pathway pseudopilin PulG